MAEVGRLKCRWSEPGLTWSYSSWRSRPALLKSTAFKYPGGEWMKQVARNLTDPIHGFLRGARYLIHDRDPLFPRSGAGTDAVGWAGPCDSSVNLVRVLGRQKPFPNTGKLSAMTDSAQTQVPGRRGDEESRTRGARGIHPGLSLSRTRRGSGVHMPEDPSRRIRRRSAQDGIGSPRARRPSGP
jgi:hypothetical protein